MSYENQAGSIARTITWRMILHLDYCSNTFGQSPCQASGPTCCYYTYPTCKDPDNFIRGEKAYAFCPAQGQVLPDSLPFLLDVRTVPTEIKPGKNVTRRARVTLEFLDDSPLALANPDKAVSNAESHGSFFRNLLARNPNARGRVAEIWQGFMGLPYSEYRLVFRGVIDRIEIEGVRARIVIKDQLKLMDKKFPPNQSSDNVLSSAYSGGGSMEVTDPTEFSAPGTVRIDDEYIDFTGASETALTGCSPGRYGSQGASHPAGSEVRQALVLAEPDDGEGLPPDEIFLTLICTHGGVDPLFIATMDRDVELTAAVDADDLLLPVSSIEYLPETGVVRIDDELVRYRGIDSSNLQVFERGAYGTTASAHSAQASLLITGFTDELGRWMSGCHYRLFGTRPTSIRNLINNLREQSLLRIWQAEDSTIAAKCLAPPFYTEELKELDDDTGFIDGTTSFDPGHEHFISRVAIHYDPSEPEPGDDPEKYSGLLAVVDREVESEEYFGETSTREIYADWIYREHEAVILASRLLIRYRSGEACLKFALELKDSELQVGDFVRVTSGSLVRPDGTSRQKAVFEIFRKQMLTDSRIEYLAMDTSLDKRYPVISPASITIDYDQAGQFDREKYGWIGNADNKVGASLDDGYYIF